ncbi:ferredoxin [Mycobacterium sp. IDR2000157661]|uniref:ferredoxin n=1 Tax=Mycobacterium sp. IDR2000157661 TaxID=2867005 RepID=UPI001EEB66F6|nr:ferredoxin [Mycobacterium sp. IDR2000157661]ULE34310.1 ferredoxin [Mycobacterium sp. IDR2000157661]
MKIAADRDVCIQAGNCVMSAGEVFDQDDDGVVVLLIESQGEAVQTGEVPDGDLDHVREAVRLCPSQALRLTD